MAFRRKRFRDHLESLADYENKLIRVAKNKVYWVKNGVAQYVPVLPFTDDIGRVRDWPEVIEVKTMPGDTRSQIVDLVNQLPSNIQQQLRDKGEQLIQQGISAIDPTDPSLLPYNAQVKNAVNTMQGMTPMNQTSLSLGSPNAIILLAIAASILIYVSMKK